MIIFYTFSTKFTPLFTMANMITHFKRTTVFTFRNPTTYNQQVIIITCFTCAVNMTVWTHYNSRIIFTISISTFFANIITWMILKNTVTLHTSKTVVVFIEKSRKRIKYKHILLYQNETDDDRDISVSLSFDLYI